MCGFRSLQIILFLSFSFLHFSSIAAPLPKPSQLLPAPSVPQQLWFDEGAYGWEMDSLNIAEMHLAINENNKNTDLANPLVCLIDSGIDANSPELIGYENIVFKDIECEFKDTEEADSDSCNTEPTYQNDFVGHGTAIATQLIAQYDSVGYLPDGYIDAENLPIQVKLDPEHGRIGIVPHAKKLFMAKIQENESDSTHAINWCTEQYQLEKDANANANSFMVISISYGHDADVNPEAEQQAVTDAYNTGGILLFAASGNTYTFSDVVSPYPAHLENMITVSAIDAYGNVMPYSSNAGPETNPDHLEMLLAPGNYILMGARRGTEIFSVNLTFSDDSIEYTEDDYIPIQGTAGTNESPLTANLYYNSGDPGFCTEPHSEAENHIVIADYSDDCNLCQQINNIQESGAQAVLFNTPLDEYDTDWLLNCNAAETQVKVTIPVMEITRSLADYLKETFASDSTPTTTIDMQVSDYIVGSGTSMAAPLAAGAALLVWERALQETGTSFNNTAIKYALIDTASTEDIAAPINCSYTLCGYGLIDPIAATASLVSPSNLSYRKQRR